MSDDKSDRELGMHRQIPRRDFLNGVSVALGASLVEPGSFWGRVLADSDKPYAPEKEPGYYPPAKTGMRGSHDGSWEVAHAMRDGKTWPNPTVDHEAYDLIVVGAGISGLSAAYFFRQHAGPKAKILVLDNHDDFGGHAKRNEFHSGQRLIIGYGGTQTITGPNLYSPQAKQLFKDLGIEVKRFETYYDQKFYSSRGMGQAVFFDKETFGTDCLTTGFYQKPWPDFLAKTPLSPAAQKDIARLFTEQVDYLAGMNAQQKKDYLAKISYQDYLLKNVKVAPDVIPFFFTSMYGLYGVGIDAVPAGDMAGLGELPGFQGLRIKDNDGPGIGLEVTRQDHEPYIYHFPDGIGSVPRLLVRSMIPGVAAGNTMEDVVLAKFNYAKLDDESSPVRVRLNSTVVHVANQRGPGAGAFVTYVRGGQAHTVFAGRCILACWNMVIPYMCPDMPQEQKEGLAYNVKVPLVYTNVQLRNWQAFDKLKIHEVHCPGAFFTGVEMDFPVSMGGYEFTQKPSESCVIHMQYVPVGPGETARDKQRTGRMKLLTTDFNTFERNIRDQLARILGSGGFDPAADIEAITVNRWPHGYAYEYNSLYDPVWPPGEAPNEIGRRPFGNIFIANSDAGAFAYTNEAIDQAYRAVQEIELADFSRNHKS
ncbi:MAG TPA: FAD/NAD(P)-binding protein [Terriglobales bacterium]|nr:FAD/NAD(P)-binding protein [Terriglobales bacterium]